MFDYSTLKIIWWLLVGVLLIGFAIMDGHDMGVGTLLPFVGRNDLERRVVINTVGPHWDGNQVWFITGGGAIFAAWPLVYATAFSGFYWAMLIVLWALFFRPVGFDYRSKIHKTPMANSYRVLCFDFSGIDTQSEESTFKFFLSRVSSVMNGFMQRYNLFDQAEIEKITAATSPGELMGSFFQSLKTWKEKTADDLPIYIIIDEYDHFTNEILIRDLSEFKRSVSQDGYIRKFYEAIKIATRQGYVDRFFITGVSPVTMDGLTSGFNIGKHLSADEKFHDMMGFTEDEVSALLSLVLIDKNRETEIIKDLKAWYNGYKFNTDVPHTLYNSDMVLYFLDNFKYKQQYPKQMLDPNIMPDYGKLMKVFQVANYHNNLDVLEEILEKGEISSEIIFQFAFIKPFDKIAFINLLYYLGNLTLKGSTIAGKPLFHIPNYVIGDLYRQFYGYVLQERAGILADINNLHDAMNSTLENGVIDPLFRILEKILQNLSNRDFQRFNEKSLKISLMSLASMANFYYIRSEREIGNDGYFDLEFLRHPSNPGKPYEYVFELKYLKQADENEKDKTMESAKTQLTRYLELDTELKALQKLKVIAVVAVKDKIYWEEI